MKKLLIACLSAFGVLGAVPGIAAAPATISKDITPKAAPAAKASRTPAQLNVIDQGATAMSVARSYNDFGFDLFRTMKAAGAQNNVVVSPFSVATCLQMVRQGARRATADQMTRALHVGTLSAVHERAGTSALLKGLTSGHGLQLEVANSFWTRPNFKLRPAFRRSMETTFQAQTGTLTDTPDLINAWVSTHTHAKIEKLLDAIDPLERAILANAVYFKGTWKDAFDSKLTRTADFTLADGTKKPCQMMFREAQSKYLSQDKFVLAGVPYNGGATMWVLVPKEGNSLADVTAGLNGEAWQTLLAKTVSRKCNLYLPKFTSQYEAELKPALTAMGMSDAFNADKADFSGMSPESGLYIGMVIHKTFMTVDEIGTEAAAVTGVGMRTLSVEFLPLVSCDHPFLCAITQDKTGAVLFLGAVTNPTAK